MATISGTSITATVPATADVAKLVPTITVSDKATVSPTTGVAQDFSKEVSYTVTAEDASTVVYKVNVSKAAATGGTGLYNESVFMNTLALNVSDGIKKSGTFPDLNDVNTDGNSLVTETMVYNFKSSGSVGMVAIDFATISQKWYNNIRMERYKSSSIDNGILYTYINGYYDDKIDRIMALDANTGTKKWEYSLGASKVTSLSSSPVVVNGVCYVSNRNTTIAINVANGQKKWETELSAISVSTDLVFNNNTVITSHDKLLTALDPETGTKKWEITLAETVRNLTSSSDFIFVDNGVNILAFDIKTGTQKWISSGNGSSSQSTVFHNGNIVVKSISNINIIDALSGNLKKQIPISFYSNKLVVANNVIYACGSEGNTIYTYAYSIDGSLKWKTPNVGSGSLFVTTGGKTYYDALSGMVQ